MSKLWQCLEEIHGLVAGSVEWRAWLGTDFDEVKSAFLGKRPVRADSIPCPREMGGAHVVVPRGDKFVAVCEFGCPDMPLSPEDVEMWEVNPSKLGRAICKALECDARATDLHSPLTWQIGVKFASAVPVVLTIQTEREDFRNVIAGLATRLRQPFILLTPTSRHWDATSGELLASARAGLFDLESHVTILGNGRLHPKTAPGILFQPFAPEAKAAASDDEARRLFALLKALESESNYRKAPVTRVFQLYCLEVQSRNEVAKACRCVPSLITLRLKAIEKKLGRKPLELRAISSQFERITDSLTDSRARHIDRERAIDGGDPHSAD